MRHRLYGHAEFIDEQNVKELLAMDFVFLCIDDGPTRKLVAETLSDNDVEFIDVGMGLILADQKLSGVTRVTTASRQKNSHLSRLPVSENDTNEYTHNIQIADLNALNAALAVIKWKKRWGFYVDPSNEHSSTYSVAANRIANSEMV